MNLNILVTKIKIKDNYRKTYDQKALDELAESIKSQGLIQPIMVNQVGEEYSLVFGQRRFLAAKQAGLMMVPCIVRENMPEEEVESLQMLENLQRQEVKPWEEAAGFAKLAKRMPLNEISARTGKAVSYIAFRIELSKMKQSFMELFKAGTIPMNIALQIARLPMAAQEKLETILGQNIITDAKRLDAIIKHHIMMVLKDASFPKDVVFGTCNRSCLECKERTGSSSLFPDISDTDYCLNSECFADKKKTHNQQIIQTQIDQYPDIVKIAHSYQNVRLSDTEEALGHDKWNVVPEDRANEDSVLRAIYVDEGPYTGKIIYIVLKEFTKEQIEAKPVVDRKEAIRQAKVLKQAKQSALDDILKGFTNTNTRILDYFIASIIASQATGGWPFKDQIAYLCNQFSFNVYNGNENDHRKREAWILENLLAITQVAMKVNILVQFLATKKMMGGEYAIFELAEFSGITKKREAYISDAEILIEESKKAAVEKVDASQKPEKKDKPKKGKSKKVESEVEEPIANQVVTEQTLTESDQEEQDLEEQDPEQLEAKSSVVIEADDIEELYDDPESEFDDLDQIESDLEEDLEEERSEDVSELPRLGGTTQVYNY